MSLLDNYQADIRKIYLIRLFAWMHFVSAVLVPFFVGWGHLNLFQILALNAWFMFCNVLLEIPTGAIADYFGKKVSIVLGCFIGALAAVIYVSRPNFIIFMVGEFLFATAFTLNSGADEAYVYEKLKAAQQEQNAKAIFGKMESFKLAGILIGALGGGIIAKFFGLKMPIMCMAIPFLFAGLIALTLQAPEKEKATSRHSYFLTLKAGLKYFRSHKTLIILAQDMAIINSLAWIIIWVYQPLLSLAGVDIIYFGVVHSLMTIAEIFFISNFDNLEKFLGGKKQLLFWSGFFAGVIYLLLAWARFAPVVIALIVVFAALGLARVVLFSNYINKQVEAKQRATILSTVSMLRTLGIVLVNPLVGLLLKWSLNWTLVVLGSLMIIFSLISRIEEEHLLD